jgi:hypothetical protein
MPLFQYKQKQVVEAVRVGRDGVACLRDGSKLMGAPGTWVVPLYGRVRAPRRVYSHQEFVELFEPADEEAAAYLGQLDDKTRPE